MHRGSRKRTFARWALGLSALVGTSACGNAVTTPGELGGHGSQSSGSAGPGGGGSGGGNTAGGGGTSGCPSLVPLLDYSVIDAEYSAPLDRLVTVSADPSALHVHDPFAQTQTQVLLAQVPTSVSIAPDGLTAAVGHDGNISIVQLQAPALKASFAITGIVGDLVLAADAAFVFPAKGGTQPLERVDAETGSITSTTYPDYVHANTHAKLHPAGNRIYGVPPDIAPGRLERYDIAFGPVVVTPSYDTTQYGLCEGMWLSAGGDHIFTRCGEVFSTADNVLVDMNHLGALPIDRVRSLWHLPTRHLIAVLPEPPTLDELPASTVALLDDANYAPTGDVPLPCIALGNDASSAEGTHLFASAQRAMVVLLLRPTKTNATQGRHALATLQLP